MKNVILTKLFLLLKIITFDIAIFDLFTCTEPKIYEFHFYVEEGKGEILILDHIESDEIAERDTVKMCDPYNELYSHRANCPDNSKVVIHEYTEKEGCSLTFMAVPEEGYKVKEWKFNEKVVKDNTTNYFLAKGTKNTPIPNIAIVSVSFELI